MLVQCAHAERDIAKTLACITLDVGSTGTIPKLRSLDSFCCTLFRPGTASMESKASESVVR